MKDAKIAQDRRKLEENLSLFSKEMKEENKCDV